MFFSMLSVSEGGLKWAFGCKNSKPAYNCNWGTVFTYGQQWQQQQAIAKEYNWI